MRVGHRHVVYVQGYDPRGLAEYYRMFRAEHAKACALYGLSGDVTRPADVPGGPAVRWEFTTRGAAWEVRTTYDFLRWEDVIRRDFERPAWWKILRMASAVLRALFDGVLLRFARAHWRFAGFAVYPLALVLLFAALAAGVGAGSLLAARALGAGLPLPEAFGAVVAGAVFVLLVRTTERWTYLLYLCDDIVSTRQFAHGERPDWEERFEAFAAHLVEVARTTRAQEVLVVGHSSGSFVAVDVVDRALLRDPGLGGHGPRVALLTLGANLPIVGFHRRAGWFRDRVARLASQSSVDWVDYQSRHDIMNFWPFDPVAGHRIALPAGQERRNPLVVHVSHHRLWAPGGFWWRRWRFFRAHFQFILANEVAGSAYDYYLICCGPWDLRTRATQPGEVVAAMEAAGDAATTTR